MHALVAALATTGYAAVVGGSPFAARRVHRHFARTAHPALGWLYGAIAVGFGIVCGIPLVAGQA
jgi:hypothetical protein